MWSRRCSCAVDASIPVLLSIRAGAPGCFRMSFCREIGIVILSTCLDRRTEIDLPRPRPSHPVCIFGDPRVLRLGGRKTTFRCRKSTEIASIEKYSRDLPFNESIH